MASSQTKPRAEYRKKSGAPDANLLVLEGTFGLLEAASLRERCLELLTSEGDVGIDASKVETITTPCIQVLLATEIECRSSGRAVHLSGASEAFTEAFADLGLQDQYDNWSNSQ